jgi:PAS domain S-box-containing protein/putative nucleotidyltransferase with HDIG domain
MKKKPAALFGYTELLHNPRRVLRAALIVAAYLFAFVILDFITKQFEELPGIVAWYPPAGLTYTLLLVFGVRFAPAVTIALFISSLFIYRMPQPLYLLFLWAFIISLIYGVAGAFLRKRIRFDWHLRKLRDVTWFVFTTVFASALLAVLSVSSSALSSGMPRSEVLISIFYWWIGETVGVLTVTPFLLIYVMPGLKRFANGQPVRLPARRSFPRPTLTGIGQVSSLAFTLYWVFGAPVLHEFQPLFLIALPLIWIALTSGFKGVSAAILALNSGVVLALLLFRFDLARLSELELLMIVNCIVGLLMGAVVTERKQTEEALRESERGLKDAQLLGRLGSWSYDLERQIITWSDQVYQLYERDPVLGPLTIEEEVAYYSPEQTQILREYTARAIEEGKSIEYDQEVNLPTGKHLSFSAKIQPIKDANGRVVKLFGTLQDITERKQREEQMTRLNMAMDNSGEAIFMADREGVITFINPGFTRLYGYTADEIVGKTTPRILKSGVMKSEDYTIFWQTLLNKQTAKGELTNKTKDGRLLNIESWSSPILNKQEEVIGFLSIQRDITQRKQREEQMTRLNMAMDNSGEAIFMADREGVITFINPGFTRLYGYTADEIVGKTTPRILKSGVMKSEDYTIFWQTLLNKQTAKGELTNKTKDGRLLNIESWSSPILNKQEEVIGFLSIQRDITQRKQREEDIRSRTDELTTLYKLSRALADANDLENVLELVNRHAMESVHSTIACIALLEDGELVTRAFYPVRSLDHDFNVGSRQPITALPYCQRVLEQNEPVILQAVSPEVGSSERATLLLDFAQSVCLVPLRVGDATQNLNQALGVLMLGEVRDGRREPFTPEKVHLARSIGDQAAATIRRLLLHEQAVRRLQRLASLSEIDRTIASNFDLRLNLQMILQHVIKQLEVDAANVLVFNDRLQILEFAAGRGFRSTAIERKRLRLGEGQAGQAALERRIVQILDFAASRAAFTQPELLEAEHIAAYFAVPLITKGQVKGVLEIYHRTPLEPNKEWLDFLNTLAGQAAIAIDVVQLFDSLQRSNTELALAYDATIEGWSHALDLRDKETEGHTQRVTEMTLHLAREMGMSDLDLVHIRRGALLHDIGKMGVPDGILLKPGPLTDEEWVVMKRHPVLAYEMLSSIRYLHAALDIPYCHHEKWDGTGYPRGLKGEDIPLTARIFAVVDVWDALTSDRPYRQAWSEEKTRQHIQAGAGTHFDPQVVKTFLLGHG